MRMISTHIMAASVESMLARGILTTSVLIANIVDPVTIHPQLLLLTNMQNTDPAHLHTSEVGLDWLACV